MATLCMAEGLHRWYCRVVRWYDWGGKGWNWCDRCGNRSDESWAWIKRCGDVRDGSSGHGKAEDINETISHQGERIYVDTSARARSRILRCERKTTLVHHVGLV